jgi:amino-acid N-acetyltransferase
LLRSKLEVTGIFGQLRIMRSIGHATAGDCTAIHKLLVEAGLPVDDLDTAPIRFWVARNVGEIVGAVGLEVYGAAGLLRSLVVKASQRHGGLGTALVQSLEDGSRRDGIELLVLLTQTAQAFFSKHGYSVQERRDVPASILQTAEFKSLCPASALCMSKTLVR